MEEKMKNKDAVFTGCDSKYWKTYGKPFVRSFQHYNPDKSVIIQIFNPDKEDIADLKSLKCEFYPEEISQSYIQTLTDKNLEIFNNLENSDHRARLKNGMKFSEKNYGYVSLEDKMTHLITFATYASYRFIRASEIWNGDNAIALFDIDSICMKPFNFDDMLGDKDAGCLAVKGDRLVVSLTAFRNNHPLLKDWGDSLKESFSSGLVYGFLDQDTFIEQSKKYDIKHIGREFCDHTKKSASSFVMTGKGMKKFGSLFETEQRKWL
jgi:hypothetical protein